MKPFMTAQEADQNYTVGIDSMVMELMKMIRAKSAHGKSLNFFTDGKHFTGEELSYIRELGFKISWNSPCLWYEVSWNSPCLWYDVSWVKTE